MDLGFRMKMYEGYETGSFIPKLPILVRCDIRNAHNLTRKMKRPFDKTMIEAMQETTNFLVEETGAKLGYTQSDEISLFFYSNDLKSQVFFDGKKYKIISQCAALATGRFNQAILSCPTYGKSGFASFDSRAWQVPTLDEVFNYFLFRQRDCIKNSISMAARTIYSDKELFGVDTEKQKKMLSRKGIDWDLYPDSFKYGTFFKREEIVRRFSEEELENLPPKHEAKADPFLEYRRKDIVSFSKGITLDKNCILSII